VNYIIEFAESIEQQLKEFPVNQRRLIMSMIKEQLSFEPLNETRNRKRLRANRLAPWELRIGDVRVFYRVVTNDEPDKPDIVRILAVGRKKGNKLLIGGEEVEP
jgi:mRNA-degrading endonuclease RelE of RelBE toxin-antitoxin system